MNATLDRQWIAQVLIIVAGCVGGWMVVVEPKVSELRKLEAVAAEARGNKGSLDQGQVERLAKKLQQVRRRVAQIETRNRFGQDPSQMYGLVLDLADEHGVVVQRLVADSAAGSTRDDAIDQVTTFHMMAEGAYQKLADFLSAIDKLEGFIRPVSLTIKPGTDNQRLYTAGEYAWDVVSFKLPGVLTNIGGTSRDGD